MIQKILTALVSFKRSIFSLILLFECSVGITWFFLWIAQDFSTMQYAGWLVFIVLIISMKIMRYAYRTPWLHLIILAVYIQFNFATIEQYTPDRVMFRQSLKELIYSGKKDIKIQKLLPFESKFVYVQDAFHFDIGFIYSCSEVPHLCNPDGTLISFPWMGDSKYKTVVVIKKDDSLYLIRILAKDYNVWKAYLKKQQAAPES